MHLAQSLSKFFFLRSTRILTVSRGCFEDERDVLQHLGDFYFQQRLLSGIDRGFFHVGKTCIYKELKPKDLRRDRKREKGEKGEQRIFLRERADERRRFVRGQG